MSGVPLLLTPSQSAADVSTLGLQTRFKDYFKDPASETNVLEVKKLMLCLAKRGESAAEVWSLIQLIQAMEGRVKTGLSSVLDVCGTGGDGLNTFNISTVAAFVIAGAGGFVAKHGNRAISSRCGSSDLMEALGVNLDAGPQKMLFALKNAGIAYLHAPAYHPLFAKIQPLRKSLGVRTLFNLTGPFLNPFIHPYQIIGVSHRKQLDFFLEILRLKKMKHALVCHSHDGLDEVSTSAPTDVAQLRDGKTARWTLRPEQYGFRKSKLSDYAGGSAKENKKITLTLLKGKLKGPARDVVLINAALGLYASGKAADLRVGIELARQSIDQNKAYQALQTLIRISQS